MRAKKREEREKKQGFFLQTKRNTVSFREGDKKGGVLALLALSGIKFTPYREQCVREWRGQRKKREREEYPQHNSPKQVALKINHQNPKPSFLE